MTKITYTGWVCLAITLIFFLPFHSNAQVSVIATSHTVVPDEEFTVDIKAVNFNEILGCQFSVNWDSLILDYQGVTNINEAFAGAPTPPFGETHADTGYLGFQWIDFTLQGISLGDTAILFSINFKTLEEQSSEHTVEFGDFPTEREIANTNEEAIDAEYISGQITIDGVSDLLEQNASKYVRISSNPNPFRGNTNITIDCMQSTEARISIFSPNGQLRYRDDVNWQPGLHSLTLPESLFGQSGTYLLKIQGTDFISTYKLIAIQ